MTNLAPPGYQTILIYGPAKIVVVTGKNDCRCSDGDQVVVSIRNDEVQNRLGQVKFKARKTHHQNIWRQHRLREDPL